MGSRVENAAIYNVSDQKGKEHEQDVVHVVATALKPNVRKSTKKEDLEEGTDFIYRDALRIDITSAFSKKDNMPFITDTNIESGIPGQNIKMGIRLGNRCKKEHGYHEFKEPVVVIGYDVSPKELDNYEDQILDTIHKHAEDIIYYATDCYYDYMEQDPEERECIENKTLQRNPKYRQPKKIGENYKKLNEMLEKNHERDRMDQIEHDDTIINGNTK